MAEEAEWLGSLLAGRYEILCVAGKGGMGVVYRAKDRKTDRIVAVKMLNVDESSNATVVAAQAAILMHKLHHPNVVPVYYFGKTQTGQPYLVMDFIQGESLASILREHGPMDFRRALPIFIQVCSALAHAHRQRLIHRDIKPANVVLLQTEDQPDFVKVVDFGLGMLVFPEDPLKQVKTAPTWGTPCYMSPEQCLNDELDVRTDIYSLGATLYETLMGIPPFQGVDVEETLTKQITELPEPFCTCQPNISIPAPLEAVVMKALEKDRTKRYASGLEMKEALEAVLLELTAPVQEEPAATQESRIVMNRSRVPEKPPCPSNQLSRAMLWGGAVLIIGTVFGAVWFSKAEKPASSTVAISNGILYSLMETPQPGRLRICSEDEIYTLTVDKDSSISPVSDGKAIGAIWSVRYNSASHSITEARFENRYDPAVRGAYEVACNCFSELSAGHYRKAYDEYLSHDCKTTMDFQTFERYAKAMQLTNFTSLPGSATKIVTKNQEAVKLLINLKSFTGAPVSIYYITVRYIENHPFVDKIEESTSEQWNRV